MKIPGILIREMRNNDIPAVSDIICAGYKWLAKMEGYTPEETSELINKRGSPEVIAKQREEYRFIVADIDDALVGAVSIRKNEITKLYVVPNLFRRGVGSTLFNHAEKIIADQGYDNISLGAFPSSAGFYEAMGMKKDGEKIPTGGPIKGRRILLYRKKIK
jgi:ribosomal protein S18 acetylase RimI-like enzyme